MELKSDDTRNLRESLDELAELTASAGGEVVGEGTQKIETRNPATYIGKGKAGEFATFCKENDVDTVIFDDELSPAQTRNLEKIFEIKILDRTALILDIFSQRARTREGKLQIELERVGEQLMPVDLRIDFRDGHSANYHIPLSLQRGTKPASATSSIH